MQEARVSPLLHHTLLENPASSEGEIQQVRFYFNEFSHSLASGFPNRLFPN
jgi:hypothetical protein